VRRRQRLFFGKGSGARLCSLAFAALEQALVEREFFLAWLSVGRGHIEIMSLESDPRWLVFIEKVKAAVEAGASRFDGAQGAGAGDRLCRQSGGLSP
jgi:hypothetical protein